jgi:hypothetical protein
MYIFFLSFERSDKELRKYTDIVINDYPKEIDNNLYGI